MMVVKDVERVLSPGGWPGKRRADENINHYVSVVHVHKGAHICP